MLTEEELVGIVKTYVQDTIEPLHLQIITQKEVIENLRGELEIETEQRKNLIGKVEQIEVNVSELPTQKMFIKVDTKADELLKKINSNTLSIENAKTLTDEKTKSLNKTILESVTKKSTEQATFEIKVMGNISKQNDHIESTLKAITADINSEVERVETELHQEVKSSTDLISLKLSKAQGEELLRVNDHINSKLTTLKGEKGDAGEKGDKGESGFLSGVSRWEAGCITKENEAAIHKSGIWLCKVKQTAKEPVEGSEWVLICDGLSGIELSHDNLIVNYSSGKQKNLGRIGFVHKGIYNKKTTYMKGDVATVNKTSFVSMEDDNTNEPPSNNWKLLSGKGEKGAKGEPGSLNLAPDDLAAVIYDVMDSREKDQ